MRLSQHIKNLQDILADYGDLYIAEQTRVLDGPYFQDAVIEIRENVEVPLHNGGTEILEKAVMV